MSLTASFVILLATIAHGLTLREEMRLAPGYIDLTSCQQYCIAGPLSWDPATDYSSWARLSTCSTKTCICAPERQASIEMLIGNSQKGFTSACAASKVEQDGAIRWVAGYCSWSAATTPTLSVLSSIVTTRVTSIFTPETTGATTFATTLTGNVQPAPSASVGNITAFRQMLKCPPCGKGSCSILNPASMPDATFPLAMGTLVTNCAGDGVSSIRSTSGGLITIGETWSFDSTIGFSFMGLNIQGGPSLSRSKSISWSQYIEIKVKPGQMGVLIAVVQYQRTTGSFKIDSNEPYRVVSNQPIRIVSYGSEIVPCNSQFSGNISSSFNCTASTSSSSNADTWLKGSPFMCLMSSVVLVVTIVVCM